MTGKGGRQAKRAVRAVLAVALIIAAIPCVDAAGRSIRIGLEASRALGVVVSDADMSFERLCVPDEPANTVPVSFEREVFSFAQLCDVRCSKSEGIACFSMTQSSTDSFSSVRDWLEQAGWRHVESGWQNMASFVKDQGLYRWLFVSCVSTGSKTAVVVQCPQFYEEG